VVFNFRQSSASVVVHYLSRMKKEMSLETVLAIPCPTCNAGPGEGCQLGGGEPRIYPHRDRRLVAKDLMTRSGGMPHMILVNLEQT
jgi:hypothetical protein